MPGEQACAHGHGQPALPASAPAVSAASAAPAAPVAHLSPLEETRPHLHISGFDPRAAGGRQAIKLELRGMPDDAPAELTMLLQSSLLPNGGGPHTFTRSLRGDWRPVVVEFSSRGREHGQYPVDVQLHARAPQARDPHSTGLARCWTATVVLLVPRADASLAEIHQTYLAARKNVRIHADDASIARLHGLDAAGPLDVSIDARNASIAQLQFDTHRGRIDLALPTIAWDEDLIEIDPPATRPVHPCPASSACLVQDGPDAGMQRHVRLFALDEWVLGRMETGRGAPLPDADLLLCHYGEYGPAREGLTRRISARHAVIRPGRQGFEIEDVSRYGLLLDGVWPGKHSPVPLRLGMRIDLTASIRGVAALVVTALLPHAVVLHRVDAGGAAECFVLLAPETAPALGVPAAASAASASAMTALPQAAALPQLFHRDGGFWHRDAASGIETALGPAAALDRLAGFHGLLRFTASAYPEHRAEHRAGHRPARVRGADRRAGLSSGRPQLPGA
jgi:hypothetical protein